MTDTFETHNAELIKCRKCPRLVAWRESVAQTKRKAYQDQTYWAKPVPGFGDQQARVMVVGLAPGAHGSNRTGRMFTGDASGNFLFRALHRCGFANQPNSDHIGDNLTLTDLFITAVCRCVPPDNRPHISEILNCQPWLQAEVHLLQNLQGYVALGKIAFDGILRMYKAQDVDLPKMVFGHNQYYNLGENLPWLLCSYHPSQQNTQTGRLTEDMFDDIWKRVHGMVNGDEL